MLSGHLSENISHFTDIFHIQNVFHIETDPEFIFDCADQDDVREGIPVFDINRRCAFGHHDGFIVKNIPEYAVYFCEYFIFTHDACSEDDAADI